MTETLYIVMRENLPDNNPGKMMAQAAHAQADFDNYIHSIQSYGSISDSSVTDLLISHRHWIQDRTFGKTIVLSALYEDLLSIPKNVQHSGIVADPTYPYRNWYGDRFSISAHTCAWAFTITEKEVEYMKSFKLHS